jgi:DNA helicase II / ATP-dependent DNA helicase PcrA
LPAGGSDRYASPQVVQPYRRSVAIQPADSKPAPRRYQIRPSSVQADLEKLYAGLNEEQLAAVTAPPGPVLVIAAAGSGKTRVVTYRVCHLVANGTMPERILLLTFTNKAAHEMLERVRAIGSVDSTMIVGGTFHRVAHRMLRKHADRIGFTRDFTLLDQEDSRDVVKLCIEELDSLALHGFKPAELQRILGLSVNTDRTPSDIVNDLFPEMSALGGSVDTLASDYAERKRALGAMDFDDLLWQLRQLLRENPAVAELYADRFEHVLVDEYQDTSKLQGDLVDLLAARHKNLMVVGDDFQSIYSFRGAHFENILSFPRRYPDARIYRLQTNYRSTPEILALANRTIEHNVRQYPKTLRAMRPGGETPALVPSSGPAEQARFVVSRIQDLLSRGQDLRDLAVLYRSHFHSLELQVELTREGIPYIIRSGVRFFEQAHVKDVVAVLRVLFNPRDEVSWSRILKLLPRIGQATAKKIVEALRRAEHAISALETVCRKAVPARGREPYDGFCGLMAELGNMGAQGAPAPMIQSILHSDYGEMLLGRHENADSRADDLEQLADYALKFGSLEEFLTDLALLSGTTDDDPEKRGAGDFLTLTTVHQAKGLEWPVVFVLWLVEGRFPSARSLSTQDDEEEERRLFYVATTRARDELYLCYPLMSYSARQGAMIHRVSRFVQEVGEEHLERWEVERPGWDL